MAHQPTTPPTTLSRVKALLESRSGQWVDGREIAKVGGYAAYRTRISDLRLLHGLTIENRVRTVRDHQLTCPALLPWVEGCCSCEEPAVYKISEYRLVVAKTEAA